MRGKEIWERILKILKKLAAEIAIEEVARRGLHILITYCKMRVVDIDELKPADAKIKNLSEVSNLKFVDRDVIKGVMTKNSAITATGRYKLVSFHNGPDGVGVGEGCFIAGMGTEFKRISAIHSHCFPVVGFALKKADDGRIIKEKSIFLHDLDDNYPSGYYILFRTK